MKNQTYINMILTPLEKKEIEKASEKLSLAFSSFCRMVCLLEARRILREANSQE